MKNTSSSFGILICLFLTSFLLGETFTVKLDSRHPETVKGYPVIISCANLKAAAGAVSTQLKDVSGTILPSQWDDLNQNGILDAEDEIAFLADIKSGENLFELQLLPGKASQPVFQPDKKTQSIRIENGMVAIDASLRQAAKLTLSRKVKEAWVPLASHYVLELNLDNSWKWPNTPEFKAILLSDGPVRKIIRTEAAKKNPDTGKKVAICHDLHLFAGRGEILSVTTLKNVTEGQILQINRLNAGFYKTLPALSPEELTSARFAGTDHRGQLISGTLGSGRFSMRRPSPSQRIWMDVSAKAYGIGAVFESGEGLDSSLATLYGKENKDLRFSKLHVHSERTLWPGRSAAYRSWYVLHEAPSSSVENFSALLQEITVKP